MNDSDHNQEELDQLLEAWHEDVSARARIARQRILDASAADAGTSSTPSVLRRILMNRYLPYAAIIALAALVVVFAIPPLSNNTAYAQDGVVMLPDGGRLDAFDADGNEIGPCALEHTDVTASVSGYIVRVDVEQVFGNPYDTAIEAVYTFPLSHRGAVDRMRMTIRSGDVERIVEGEIEERGRAREIYELARDSGYVASLLEQERPNIFTQSVANIEPGAEITIAISYVETLEEIDGTYKIVFPTVVGPRYIPGYPAGGVELPPGCTARRGIILRGPATLAARDSDTTVDESDLALITDATPIEMPKRNDGDTEPELVKSFKVSYTDGSEEPGAFFADNTGVIGGRWFCWQPPEPGAPFAQDTDQVPDASKITPMPVRPGTRAGHDISITVEIETGGAEIATVKSPLHEIVEVPPSDGKGSKGRKVFELTSKNEIPNRDFILEWTLGGNGIQESILTHAKDRGTAYVLDGPEEGITIVDGHLAVFLNPPARVEDADVPARELVFVLDTSGSMTGFPIEKAKAVMTRAIDSMRPEDTFNLITFAGDTRILWEQPRPATAENRKLANNFINSRQGGGGTEMMKAINAALTQKPADERTLNGMELANLPADGRTVRVRMPFEAYSNRQLDVNSDIRIDIETQIAIPERPAFMEGQAIHGALPIEIDGRWVTRDGRRFLVVDSTTFLDENAVNSDPMRIVVFMTDGYVGNDDAILASIRKNAATTRVFSFGIGNSVNRYLLDGMAEVGRGAVEYVTLEGSSADDAVERFSRRIQTPVLIDLSMETEGIVLQDVLPSGQYLPDLYDEKPIVILARYEVPGEGTITLRGRTGSGPWSRTIEVTLPEEEKDNDVIATLWAREKVDEILAPHLEMLQMGTVNVAAKDEVIALGKEYSIMTPFTSFVAVEKTRVVSDGKPMLVHVPIELPSGTSWEGFFGNDNAHPIDASLEQIALGLPEPKLEESDDASIMVGDAIPDSLVETTQETTAIAPPPAPPGGQRSYAREGSQFGSSGDGGQLMPSGGTRSNTNWYSRSDSRGRASGRRISNLGAPAAPASARSGRSFGAGGGSGGRLIGGHEAEDEVTLAFGMGIDEDAKATESMGLEEKLPSTNPTYLEPEEFQRLARVLDRPLFRVAIMSLLPKDILSSWEFSNEESLLKLFREPVLVSVKLDNLDDERLAALKKAGFEVVGTNETTGVVVGRATARQLAAIGLLPGVLRVVPTSIQPDEAS